MRKNMGSVPNFSGSVPNFLGSVPNFPVAGFVCSDVGGG